MRLTKQLREATIKRVVDEAIAKRLPDLEEREMALANAVYLAEIGEENMRKMAAMPSGYFQSSDEIHLRVVYREQRDQQEVEKSFGYKRPEIFDSKPYRNRYSYPLTMGRSRLHPACRHNYDVERDGKLGRMTESLMADFEKLHADIQVLRESLHAMLYSANTTEQLLKIWPDGEKYLPKDAPNKEAKLPAITADTLNKTIECAFKGDCEEVTA